MGGFRFNGCGATDHYKKIKSLGMHLCPVCKKDAEFFLEEARFKIDIFFIPTVTIKSRYAVMCGKCGQGEYCSDQWAINLSNSVGTIPVIFESQAQTAAPISASEQSASPLPEKVTYVSAEQAVQQPLFKGGTAPSFFKCPNCGVTQLREGAFCAFCGKPAPEDPNIAPGAEQSGETPTAISVCPVCGNRQEADKKFCAGCGHPMDKQVPSERVCPGCGTKIEGNATFCMECGMKL